MDYKTPLERDIERNELFKTPLSIKVLIVLLIAGLAALGLYTLNLKQEMTIKKQEIAEIKELFQEEKLESIEEIRKLSEEVESLEPE
jgi:Tfp pilus assembly protein PilO